MKKLNIKVLSILAAMTGLFASCSQDELVKSEIDAQNYPAATIELSDITLGNVGTTTAELSSQISANAKLAEEASTLSQEAGAKVAESNEFMSELTTAMEDITAKAGEIGKIIKTII